MGFSWDLADTMIKASIQFSKTHKNHILPGDLNRILIIAQLSTNPLLNFNRIPGTYPFVKDKFLLISLAFNVSQP
jgi:hypothetical protein